MEELKTLHVIPKFLPVSTQMKYLLIILKALVEVAVQTKSIAPMLSISPAKANHMLICDKLSTSLIQFVTDTKVIDSS
jgi:hypothetical protein